MKEKRWWFESIMKDRLVENLLNTDSTIEIDQSRCLRMRHNKNSCNRCLKRCHFGAIRISDNISIDTSACSECMICVSVCPTDTFQIGAMNFYSITARLRKHQSPVLGCHARPGLVAHEKTVCLGFLSEEHLLALLFLVKKPLQINLTECKDCKNGFVVGAIQERLSNIEENTSINVFDTIKVVKNEADLDYQAVSYDRRGFFRALKGLTVQGAVGFLDRTNGERTVQPYSRKVLPIRRELLNRSFSVLPGDMRERVLESYYYDIEVDEICNQCFACVGMCPTGAFKITNHTSDKMPFFNSALCSGCGLCEGFCRSHSISLKKGFFRGQPFEFDIPKRTPLAS